MRQARGRSKERLCTQSSLRLEDQAGASWRIYHGDVFAQSAFIHGLLPKYVEGWMHGSNRFRTYDHFDADLQRPGFPKYTFIEPYWDLLHPKTYRRGNSEHPTGDIADGEALIKATYESIRKSELYWNCSALLILYDEHGGYYDSIAPPCAVPTGDDTRYAVASPCFDFTRLGFRVPALMISPWVEKCVTDSTQYDHAAIPKLIGDLFGIPPLTKRVEAQNSLLGVFSRDTPRDDAPMCLPDVYRDHSGAVSRADPTNFLKTFVPLVRAIDAELGDPPLADPCLDSASDVTAYFRYVAARLTASKC